MSLYGKYLAESFGKEIVEDSHGFATFSIVKDECYVENVFVLPEFRSKKKALCYIEEIVEIAKTRQCKYLTTTVNPGINNPERSMKIILSYGFKLHSCDQNKIIFMKEL
jgi:hypothetical protein